VVSQPPTVTTYEPEPEPPAPEGPAPGGRITLDLFGNQVPLVGASGITWSLFDLICALIALISAFILLVRALLRRRGEGEEGGDASAGYGAASRQTGASFGPAADSTPENERPPASRTRLRVPLAFASLLAAAASAVLFALTQDIRLPMALFDFWSVFFAALAILGVITTILAFHSSGPEAKDGEGDEARQYA
jgi:hypothetical protein